MNRWRSVVNMWTINGICFLSVTFSRNTWFMRKNIYFGNRLDMICHKLIDLVRTRIQIKCIDQPHAWWLELFLVLKNKQPTLADPSIYANPFLIKFHRIGNVAQNGSSIDLCFRIELNSILCWPKLFPTTCRNVVSPHMPFILKSKYTTISHKADHPTDFPRHVWTNINGSCWTLIGLFMFISTKKSKPMVIMYIRYVYNFIEKQSYWFSKIII